MSSTTDKEMQTESISLHQGLKKYFGFDKFKGSQQQVIESVLAGEDTFVIMPTGGGKSLCYQLPALISEGTAIVISPLIALMKNQVDSIRNYGSDDGVAHFMNSSLTKTELNRVKDDITRGITKLVYLAPESLTKQENIDFLRDIKISFVAVDEAHCISEWGHDFRPEYRRIRQMIQDLGQNIPIMALTATATPKVASDIQKNLGMMDAKLYKASFNRPNLYYEVRPKVNPEKQIIKFIKEHPGKSGIIYCLSRKKVEEIAETLNVNGIKALPYHAGFDANTRAKNQDMFLMEEVDVIVATIAFGMGIDKPDVRFVIHYDIPKSLEGYYQETGRAGRDGGEGKCIALYDYKDIEKLEKFLQNKPVAEQEIGRQLLEEVVSYAETSMSRRKFLLNYFGEEFDEVNGLGAKMDDNATNPKERIEGKDDVVLLLKAVKELKEKYKMKYVANFMAGKLTTEIKTFKHHESPLFGVGKEKDDKYWQALIRQVVVSKLLKKEIESYGLLKITPEGEAFLKKPHSFMVTKDHDYDQLMSDDDAIVNQGGKSGGAADETLYKLLLDLRKKLSKEKSLPPYVIFQEASLEDMATQYPITEEELRNIVGVGVGKAARFGKPFIQLIKKYVDENEIDRPVDMVVKSVVNKSGLKVFIIQSIDRKMSLEDIAKSKGLELMDVIMELENIVNSGTRININYYLDEEIDEEKQEEIYDYFMEAESDSVQDALAELGEDEYSEEEVRLVRIKFLSEVAN